MRTIPRDGKLDSSLSMVRDPYWFILKRCRRLQTEVFQTRLMLQNTICLIGKDAAELFYDSDRFLRAGAAFEPMQKTLLGRGGVQETDGQEHRRRKQMFMNVMTTESINRLANAVDGWWQIFSRRWSAMEKVVLYPELHELLLRGVCGWAGVPLSEEEVSRRTSEIAALFDAAGSAGVKHFWARMARGRAEKWTAELIDRIRAGQFEPPDQSAARVIAHYREPDGSLLDRRAAAVELLNVLRPTVAVSVYITHAAHALAEHPECRERLRREDDFCDLFVHEVRRFYPFFPFIAARVRRDFEWREYRFPAGTRVLLDITGTNRDPREWEAPDEFRPERFRRWNSSAFNFIPQGGGSHYRGHRCAGEWATIELMKRAVRFLTEEMDYDVPEQDLWLDFTRAPALPHSRMVLANVRTKTRRARRKPAFRAAL